MAWALPDDALWAALLADRGGPSSLAELERMTASQIARVLIVDEATRANATHRARIDAMRYDALTAARRP